MSSEGKVRKKPDAALVAVIVMAIIAAVILLISIIILFVIGGKDYLSDKKNNLLAAGAMLSIAVPMAIVSAIITGVFISRKSQGKDVKGLFWTSIILSIITGILVIIAAIISFVTANQIRSLFPDDARSLDAAGAMMLIGFVIFIVAFFVFVFRARMRLAPEERKIRQKNLFSRRRAPTSVKKDEVITTKVTETVEVSEE
ncbi:MAG: hypothetical protein ACMG6E_00520 [Candidatus Roizmanbacteria bacterium]